MSFKWVQQRIFFRNLLTVNPLYYKFYEDQPWRIWHEGRVSKYKLALPTNGNNVKIKNVFIYAFRFKDEKQWDVKNGWNKDGK